MPTRRLQQGVCNRQHWHWWYLPVQGPANVDAIGLLVELGANLWSVMKDADMETPLHMASRSGRLDIVEKLLRCGADFSKKTKVSRLGSFSGTKCNRIAWITMLCFMRLSCASMHEQDKDCLGKVALYQICENTKYLVHQTKRKKCARNESRLFLTHLMYHSLLSCRMGAHHCTTLPHLGRHTFWKPWSRQALRSITGMMHRIRRFILQQVRHCSCWIVLSTYMLTT